jgi:hypothetical protein
MAKNYSKPLRAYVYGLLNGNVTDDASANVPVANHAYNGLAYPHVLVKSQAFAEDGTKDLHGGNYSLIIEVVTRFDINEGGQDLLDEISNNVMQLLPVRLASPVTLDTTGQLTIFRHTNDNTLEEEDERYRYFWRRMIFECYIIDS